MRKVKMNRNIKIVTGNALHSHFSKNWEKMIDPEAKKNKMLKWNEADLKKAISDSNSVLALVGEEAVGFVCLILRQKYVEICALIVTPEHRKRGIGMALMEKAISLAKEEHSDKSIILFSNEISSRMCEKFGFVIADKKSLNIETWKACDVCPEHKNFPDCRCQPMMLVPTINIKQRHPAKPEGN